LLLIAHFSYSQQISQPVDRIALEDAGIALQRYVKMQRHSYVALSIGAASSIIGVASMNNGKIAPPFLIVAWGTTLTAVILQVSSLKHLNVAGQKLEIADSGIGIKFRF